MCHNGATYVVTVPKGKEREERKDHAFSCGQHLGEIVRSAIEGSLRCKVKVAYCPAPGDQPCEWGVQ
jgi:hypothetical protein